MPVVVEFNGIPGVGKTTIAKQVEKILRKEGLKVLTSEGLKWDTLYNEMRLLVDIDVWRFCYYLCTSLSKKIWLPNKYLIASARMYVSIRDFLIKPSDFDVLLLDQGLIQILCAVGGIKKNKRLDYRPVFSFLSKKKIRILIIDCDNNIKLAEARIAHRHQQSGRFDCLNETDRHEAYTLWTKRLDVLRTQARTISKSHITVDCSKNPDQNAMTISKMIFNKDR